MLYMKDKPCVLFRDCGEKYRPVSLYLGSKKIAGYEYAELEGTHLSIDNTYNDTAYIKINGKTNEVGTGEKSPDNPYELVSVEGDVVSCGKNLLDVDYFKTKLNEVVPNTIVEQGDGSFWIKSHSALSKIQFFKGAFKSNTQYTLTFDIKGKDNKGYQIFYFMYTDGTSSSTNRYTGNTWTTQTYTSTAGKTISYIRILWGLNEGNYNRNITLHEGTTAIDYKPYKGSRIPIPAPLGNLPDGTADYFIVDNKAKKAWVERNVVLLEADIWKIWQVFVYNPELRYDNSEVFGHNYSEFGGKPIGVVSLDQVLSNLYKKTNLPPFSNYIKHGDIVGLDGSPYFYTATSRTLLGIEPDDTPLEKRDKYLNWINEIGLEVLVPLAEPCYEELPYEQVKTFYPYTQVYTTSEVQPTIEAKVRVIGNKITEE